MTDEKIIELYFSRNEAAVGATAEKYSRLLTRVSEGIVASRNDAEECVNDTYLAAWNSIPPTRPRSLSAYLCRIVRNLSINRYRSDRARRSIMCDVIIDELYECIPDGDGDAADDLALREALNSFVSYLPERERLVFVKRYFYTLDVGDIAREMQLSVSNVKVILHRTRVRLREFLERKDILI